VAGFADTKPIKGIDVTDPSNRRVTLLLRLDNHLD
jgi:flagellar motor protein MotB